VYFVLDVSESMAGDELYQLEEAVRSVLTVLRRDPTCLEMVWVSTIVFAGQARTLVPLTEVAMFNPPELPLGGGTALGTALEHLMGELDTQLVKSTPETKGDWKALVFLMTDGHPTDDPHAAIARWRSEYSSKANVVAVSIGGQASHEVLRELTDDVVVYLDSTADSLASLVRWVSQSIQTTSRRVQEPGNDDSSLSLSEGDAIAPAPVSPVAGPTGDDRYIAVIGRCSRTRQPYLVKYARDPQGIADLELPPEIQGEYLLRFATPLRDSYLELCAPNADVVTIDMSQLLGQPDCPHCGAAYTMAIDHSCGNVHCVTGPGDHVCPWCGSGGEYGHMSSGEHVRVRRGQG